MKKFITFALSILTPLLVGFIGSFSTMDSISSWYTDINKPSFNPPNWIFGPVWTLLYIMMGISFYLVVTAKAKNKKKALILFGIQLFLNLIWSPIFFTLHNPFLSFVDIVFLWVFILLTIKSFYPISKFAAYLLIPYILWVSFAAVLNYAIFYLNI